MHLVDEDEGPVCQTWECVEGGADDRDGGLDRRKDDPLAGSVEEGKDVVEIGGAVGRGADDEHTAAEDGRKDVAQLQDECTQPGDDDVLVQAVENVGSLLPAPQTISMRWRTGGPAARGGTGAVNCAGLCSALCIPAGLKAGQARCKTERDEIR